MHIRQDILIYKAIDEMIITRSKDLWTFIVILTKKVFDDLQKYFICKK